ncbi:MAG: hypothetical protein H6831_06620 [Planctomycetes bacterium]|nr:hypothetical protein [Planctomycetota bacterium]MCB9904063.1 hypothetical protein [Planctomycetota bacterium]
MNWKTWLRPGALVAVAALAVGMASPSPEGVEVGEKISYTFREPMLNAMGITKLEDLRGKPVIVEFWGTR